MAIEAHGSYWPKCRKSSTYNSVLHTYMCTCSLSNSIYVNKVPLDSLCSPSCFHPICTQSVASSLSTNTNTHWYDQEQQQCVHVHLMHSWGFLRVNIVCTSTRGGKLNNGTSAMWWNFSFDVLLCIMGYIMKCPTISFVNLFSLFPQAHCWNSPVIWYDLVRLLSHLGSILAGGVHAGSERPSCTSYESDKSDSERLRMYGLLMEYWLVTMCVVEEYGERKRHSCILGCTCF